jgi:tetratricopeptide (TPR) repeat protein
MQRQLDLAITEFTTALTLNAGLADAWKRRGQTKAAKGLIASAIKDLTRALSIEPEADIYNQRALVYHQVKNYRKAMADFQNANAKGMNTPTILNFIGMCEGQLGNVNSSIKHHKSVLAIDKNFKEAHLNMALMHKELGQHEEALKYFASALAAAQESTGKPFHQVHIQRSVMYYQLGALPQSCADLQRALSAMQYSLVPHDQPTTTVEKFKEEILACLMRYAMCYQSVGNYRQVRGWMYLRLLLLFLFSWILFFACSCACSCLLLLALALFLFSFSWLVFFALSLTFFLFSG